MNYLLVLCMRSGKIFYTERFRTLTEAQKAAERYTDSCTQGSSIEIYNLLSTYMVKYESK